VTTRRVVGLDGEALAAIPPRCQGCLFWEFGRPRRDLHPEEANAPGDSDELSGDPAVTKQAWCSAQCFETGPPGRLVTVNDEVAGYASFAPSGVWAPRRPPIPPLSGDALLLATLWVEPAFRRQGIGRLLVQSAVKEAIRLDLASVEAYGDRRWRESDCVLPAMWLLHEGFEVVSEHPRYPLLRIATRRTARWTQALENVVEEVLERIPRRVPATEPTPEVTSARP
jgi:GNAT superfamily N-acetyltransferase